MKLEVGKYYRTRDGRRVKIVSNDGHELYPFNDSRWSSYTKEGNYWWSGDLSERDLIAEWTETTEVGTLKEIGAQVGDVVEWVFDSEVTETYEVMSIRESMYGMRAHLKGYGEGVFTDQKFRIVSRANKYPSNSHCGVRSAEGPVRTVTTTRKEIVPGVYGLVTVDDGAVRMGYFMPDEDNPSKLSEAIATLTEIRDALAE